ncbi:hypothetical protein D9M69_308900 [compost metagenome]
MHQAHEAFAAAGGGPLQHLQVAVGVAEGEDRPAADDRIDAHRLAGAVVVVGELGLAQDRQRAVLVLQFGDEGGADHLLRGDAVDLLGEGAHEGDLAAGDDVGLEAVAAQVGEQFQHRLVDHLGVRLLALRVSGLGQPGLGAGAELLGADAGVGGADDLDQPFHAAGREGFAIALEHRLERLLLLPFRVLGGQALDFVEGEQHLEVHRLLAPQRAVVVEHGNALGGRHVVPAALGGHGTDEAFDGLLRRAVVPGRQRIRARCQQGQQQGQRDQPAPGGEGGGRGRHGISLLCEWRGFNGANA